MYTLIGIIFIAELIITFQILSFIVKFDRKICDINCCLKEFNPFLETLMKYVRLKVTTILESISKAINIINDKKRKAIVRIAIIVAINLLFIIFRIKKLKTNKVINLAVALLDIVADLKVL